MDSQYFIALEEQFGAHNYKPLDFVYNEEREYGYGTLKRVELVFASKGSG